MSIINDRPSVEEKIGRALADGDLDYRSNAINAVIALGCVSIEEKVADAVFRLKYANDAHSYADAVKAVSGIAKSLDARHNWRLKDHAAIATAVVNYWLCDLCPSCTGIGAQAIAGTPVLGTYCPACRGSGKRDYPWQGTGRAGQYHTATLCALEEAERRIKGKLLDRLAHQIRDSGVLR